MGVTRSHPFWDDQTGREGHKGDGEPLDSTCTWATARIQAAGKEGLMTSGSEGGKQVPRDWMKAEEYECLSV